MKTPRWLLVFAATAVVSVATTILAIRWFDDETPIAGVLPGTLQSALLGEAREFFVHLPEGYTSDATTRYPVLYVLDGTSQSGHAAESARLLARVGMIPPMIVVGVPSPDGGTRNRDYTPPGMRLDTDAAAGATGAADTFLSFLGTELIGRIERDYRTARPRMLAGWSRGGLFVVYSAIAAPALFDARFAHSPALWRENDLMVMRLQGALTGGTPPPGLLYLSLGERENEKMTAAFRHAITVLDRDAPPTLNWRADISAGGQHESNPRLSTPVGLCVMFRPGEPCQGTGVKEVSRRTPAAR